MTADPLFVQEFGQWSVYLDDHPFWELYREYSPFGDRTFLLIFDDKAAAERALYERTLTPSHPYSILARSVAMYRLNINFCPLCGDAIKPSSELDAFDGEIIHASCGRNQ